MWSYFGYAYGASRDRPKALAVIDVKQPPGYHHAAMRPSALSATSSHNVTIARSFADLGNNASSGRVSSSQSKIALESGITLSSVINTGTIAWPVNFFTAAS